MDTKNYRLAIFRVSICSISGGVRFLFERRDENGNVSPAKEVKVDWKVRSEKDPACLVVSGLPNLHDRKGEDVHQPNENRGVPHLPSSPTWRIIS